MADEERPGASLVERITSLPEVPPEGRAKVIDGIVRELSLRIKFSAACVHDMRAVFTDDHDKYRVSHLSILANVLRIHAKNLDSLVSMASGGDI